MQQSGPDSGLPRPPAVPAWYARVRGGPLACSACLLVVHISVRWGHLLVVPACDTRLRVVLACLRLVAPVRGNHLHFLLAVPACCTWSSDGLVVHACGAFLVPGCGAPACLQRLPVVLVVLSGSVNAPTSFFAVPPCIPVCCACLLYVYLRHSLALLARHGCLPCTWEAYSLCCVYLQCLPTCRTYLRCLAVVPLCLPASCLHCLPAVPACGACCVYLSVGHACCTYSSVEVVVPVGGACLQNLPVLPAFNVDVDIAAPCAAWTAWTACAARTVPVLLQFVLQVLVLRPLRGVLVCSC